MGHCSYERSGVVRRMPHHLERCVSRFDRSEIVARIQGELSPDELTERIDWLLGNRAARRPEALIRHLGGAG